MFCFLYLERNPNGRWIFLIYSLLPKKALEGLKAHICIKSEGRNCFAAYLNILPMMSVTKLEAVSSGNVLVLFDEQLKDGENQAKVFDYVVKIGTTAEFRAALNHNDEAGALAKYQTNVLSPSPSPSLSLAQPVTNTDKNEAPICPAETILPTPRLSPQSPVIVTIASDDEEPVLSHENLARGRLPRLWRQVGNVEDHDYAIRFSMEDHDTQ